MVRSTLWVAMLVCTGLSLPVTVAAAPPAIEHAEPTSGPPGSVVHIVGRRFQQGAEVWLGDQPLPVERVLPSRLTVRVPESAHSGRLTVRSGGEVARGPEFRVTAPRPLPVIERVTPAEARAGAEITVRGRNFSPRLTGNLVDIGGTPAVVRAASPVALTVIVPEGSATGPIRVRVPGVGDASSDAHFQVLASTRVESVAPLRAGPGAELLVSGVGFSDDPKRNHVFIANRPVKVIAASAKQLKVQVPERPVSGPVLVDVDGAGRAQSAVRFEAQAPPTITGFEPQAVRPGESVRVRGGDFGSDAASVRVQLGDRELEVLAVSPDQLSVRVPKGAVSGALSVSVHGVGPVAAPGSLAVLAPLSLTRFSPHTGPVGATVTLTGTGLGDAGVARRVTIGGVEAPIVSEAEGQLRVRVPDASSGRVSVTVAGERVFSKQPFVVTRPPRITGVSDEQLEAGAELVLRGAGFGDNAKVLAVSVGGEPATVLAAKDGELRVRVGRPSSGKVAVKLPLHGRAESEAIVTVLASVSVSSVAPARASAGDTVVVRGAGFIPGKTRVAIAGKAVEPGQVAATKLEFVLPSGTESGEVEVQLGDGRRAKAPKPLQVMAPAEGASAAP